MKVPEPEDGLDGPRTIGGGSASYAVLLVCREIDAWNHNGLFADELIPAFAELGLRVETVDYRAEARRVSAALKDPQCLFFMCFNGFGSELRVAASLSPAHMSSVYEVFGKDLYDLMHDYPAHDWMSHQVDGTGGRRNLLLTDYGYVAVARRLGIGNVRYAASIAFPNATPASFTPHERRSIDVLLPVGLSPPKTYSYPDLGSVKGRVRRMVFDSVVEATASDWRLDPVTELMATCHHAGLALDEREPEDRFYLSCMLDHVKFLRRERLLRAVSDLPVTVVTDRPLGDEWAASRFDVLPSRPAKELVALMADSRVVICPTPHANGFHERLLGAFSAGAAVVASPNSVVETCFVHGRDYASFAREDDVATLLEDLLAHPDQTAAMGESGRSQALSQFPPRRLAQTILSLHSLNAAMTKASPSAGRASSSRSATA